MQINSLVGPAMQRLTLNFHFDLYLLFHPSKSCLSGSSYANEQLLLPPKNRQLLLPPKNFRGKGSCCESGVGGFS